MPAAIPARKTSRTAPAPSAWNGCARAWTAATRTPATPSPTSGNDEPDDQQGTTRMTVRHHLIALLLAGLAAPALAQTQPVPAAKPSDAARPVNERDPSAVDVVATPVTDLNLRKGEIPPALVAAEADPYGLPGGGRCPAMAAEVRRLDAVLGDDVDIAQASRGRVSPGKVAQSVVGSFIPFRGIIREISGANEQQRRLQSA